MLVEPVFLPTGLSAQPLKILSIVLFFITLYMAHMWQSEQHKVLVLFFYHVALRGWAWASRLGADVFAH